MFLSGCLRKNLSFPSFRGHLHSLAWVPSSILKTNSKRMKSFSCHISLTLLSVYSSSTFKDFIIRLGPSGSFRVISPPQGYLISNFKCMYHFNFLLSCNIISTQIQRIKTWLSLGAIILPTIFGLLDWNFSYIVRFISHEPGSFHFYFLVVANAFYILKLSTWSC